MDCAAAPHALEGNLFPPAGTLSMQRADSIGSRPTASMTLIRALHMLRSLLSDWLIECELYSIMAVSRELHTIVAKDIARLRVQETRQHDKLRSEIERDLAVIAAARALLSPNEAAALDAQAFRLLECPSFHRSRPEDAGQPAVSLAQLTELRSLVFAGAVVTGRDYEGFLVLAKMLRHMLIKPAETSWWTNDHARAGSEEECAWVRELFQLCLLSNPALCRDLRGRHSSTSYSGCVEELDSMFMCVLYLSRDGVQPGDVHLPSMLALADLCLWFVQLYHLTPLSDYLSQWQRPEEVMFDECTSMIGRPPRAWFHRGQCAPEDDPPRLKQMRWSILRACTGGGESYGRDLFCHAPLIDSQLHPHPMMLCEDHWAEGVVCAVCRLGDLRTAYSCAPCQFRVHAACAPPRAQHVSSSSSSQSASAVLAPVHPPPSEWLYEQCAFNSTEFLQSMWTCCPDLLGVLVHGSNSAFWLRLRLSLLQRHKLSRASSWNSFRQKERVDRTRSCLQDWIDAAVRDQHTRHTFAAILTHPTFSATVMQMERRSDAASEPSYLLRALFFELLGRKERTILQRWLSAERSYFLSAWPQLLDFASGLGPLHFVCTRVRGCRHRLFRMLLQLTCDSMATHGRVVAPAEVLLLRGPSGESIRDLLALPRNRDLWEAAEDSLVESREESEKRVE